MKFRKLLCCAIAVILILTIMIPTVFAATKCTVTQNVMFRQGPEQTTLPMGRLSLVNFFIRKPAAIFGHTAIRAKILPFIGSLAISTVTLPETYLSW